MDEDDIVEIHPFKKHKRAILHNVFDIDNGDDSEDLVIIGEKVSKSNKREGIRHDVIDIDESDDSDDFVIISEDVSKSNKGKTIETIHKGMAHSDNVDISHGIAAPESDLILKESKFEVQPEATKSHVKDIQVPKEDNVAQSPRIGLATPQLLSRAGPSKKKSTTSKRSGDDSNTPLGELIAKALNSKAYSKALQFQKKAAGEALRNFGRPRRAKRKNCGV